MSKRLNLREFQQRLIDRLQDKSLAASRISTLGIQIAGNHWLVDMTDIGEVLPLPEVTPVPLTKPWFKGVVNVRGSLFTVTDMAVYLGAQATPHLPENRILLAAERYGFNAALLVERVLGLRDARSWRQIAPLEYHDDENKLIWRKLDVPALLAQADFLQIAN